MRNKAPMISSVQGDHEESRKNSRDQGTAHAITSFIDPSFCWKDLEWLQGITKLPIVLKGIQTGEDAVLAARQGVAGIVVSNHGGRQMLRT